MGVAILKKSKIINLAGSFHQKEEEESTESCSFMFVLDYLERKK